MGQCGHKARATGSSEGTTSLESSTLSATAGGPQRCGGEVAPGFASSSSNPARSSEYYSARIQSMIESTGEYETAVDAEIKASEVHWSELPESDKQRCAEADKAFFESLRQQGLVHGLNFFAHMSEHGWELGEKIAEGAQGVIYGLKAPKNDMVLKVFKAEAGSLEALHKQWPPGFFNGPRKDKTVRFYPMGLCLISKGVMLEDGRFGFLMRKHWGDLRKMIDERMMHNGNRAAPFRKGIAFEIMYWIATGMRGLHRNGIVHRDLKASNVLIEPTKIPGLYFRTEVDSFDPLNDTFMGNVADFESSAMTVGTTFWRAPEVLAALKSGSFEPNVCTEKSDVYGFSMTCYEILTGKIPFEGELSCNYGIVLGGERPELPSDTYPWIQSMLDRCWHHAPSKRPSFKEIVKKFDVIKYSSSSRSHKILKSKF